MAKITSSLLTPASLLALGLSVTPADAQSRVFVGISGNDANPCTVVAPCRTFQRAHDAVAANGEIDVLDPAGYGKVIITKSLSIQGHGFAGISAASGDAIAINAGASDNISLRGLLLDGVGSAGQTGIAFNTGFALDVQDCVIRNFFANGIRFNGDATLSVSYSHITHNANGILVNGPGFASGTIHHVVSENNFAAINISMGTSSSFVVSNSVLSNSSQVGVRVAGNGNFVLVRNVIIAPNNFVGVQSSNNAFLLITGSSIFRNSTGFATDGGAQLFTYKDNFLAANVNDGLAAITGTFAMQ